MQKCVCKEKKTLLQFYSFVKPIHREIDIVFFFCLAIAQGENIA